jgi:hypothetical protein
MLFKLDPIMNSNMYTAPSNDEGEYDQLTSNIDFLLRLLPASIFYQSPTAKREAVHYLASRSLADPVRMVELAIEFGSSNYHSQLPRGSVESSAGPFIRPRTAFRGKEKKLRSSHPPLGLRMIVPTYN